MIFVRGHAFWWFGICDSCDRYRNLNQEQISLSGMMDLLGLSLKPSFSFRSEIGGR